jgi:hypothetical protein
MNRFMNEKENLIEPHHIIEAHWTLPIQNYEIFLEQYTFIKIVEI